MQPNKDAMELQTRLLHPTYQQEMTGLHAEEFVDVLEELAAWIVFEQVLTLFILAVLLRHCRVYAVMLPGGLSKMQHTK